MENIDIVKMLAIPIMICRYNVILIKFTAELCIYDKITDIYTEKQRLKNSSKRTKHED